MGNKAFPYQQFRKWNEIQKSISRVNGKGYKYSKGEYLKLARETYKELKDEPVESIAVSTENFLRTDKDVWASIRVGKYWEIGSVLEELPNDAYYEMSADFLSLPEIQGSKSSIERQYISEYLPVIRQQETTQKSLGISGGADYTLQNAYDRTKGKEVFRFIFSGFAYVATDVAEGMSGKDIARVESLNTELTALNAQVRLYQELGDKKRLSKTLERIDDITAQIRKLNG